MASPSVNDARHNNLMDASAIGDRQEVDPAFNDRVIILADTRNRKPLDAKSGPLQIIVAGEKMHARISRPNEFR